MKKCQMFTPIYSSPEREKERKIPGEWFSVREWIIPWAKRTEKNRERDRETETERDTRRVIFSQRVNYTMSKPDGENARERDQFLD